VRDISLPGVVGLLKISQHDLTSSNVRRFQGSEDFRRHSRIQLKSEFHIRIDSYLIASGVSRMRLVGKINLPFTLKLSLPPSSDLATNPLARVWSSDCRTCCTRGKTRVKRILDIMVES